MKNTFLLTISFLLPLFLSAQSQRYYVDQLAFGQNNGQSWTDAFQELHDALTLAEAGDEIWVAKGQYRPSTTNDRMARFQLLSGVRLYGGFAGTELDLSERDWTGTSTVLDGDIGTLGDSTDNTYNLLYLYRPDSLTIVDGFTFRGAVANDSLALPGTLGASGAALYIMAFDGEAYPTIRHCIFAENTALQHGGAVYIEGGGSGSVAPVFEQCRFTDNRAVRGNGGAVYRNGGSWVDRPEDLKNCVFRDNSAYLQGGALYFADSPRTDTFDVVQTIWENNRILHEQIAPIILQSSGLQITNLRTNGATTIDIKNLQASRCNTGNGFILAGDVANFEAPNLILRIDTMSLDSTQIVSGDLLGWAQTTVKNVYLINSSGIGVVSYAVSTHSLFKNITVKKSIPYLFFVASSEIVDFDQIVCLDHNDSFEIRNVGGIDLNATNIILNTNKMLIHLSRFSPGKVKFSNSTVLKKFFNTNIDGVTPEITNCILLDEAPYFLPPAAAYTPIFDHNLFNFPDTFPTSNWITTNNLWATDPQFMQPDSGDFRLQPCSPAIDAGTNTAVTTATDAAGQPRIQGGTVDMGAYEAPAFGLIAAPAIKPACDSTANGAIIAPLAGVCAPLNVAWQSGSQSGTTLDHLAPGLYQVTLTDAQGRSLHFDAEVPVGLPPVLYVQGSPISCFGANDGRLTVQPLTGQPPFSYQWSPPVTTDSIATHMPPGPASVTVTDAWGCSSAFNFQVPEPDTLQFAATVQDAAGAQSATGSIQVTTVTGGTAPYDYLWSPVGSMESTLGNLTPGLYTLTVTDERGCESAWTFEVRYTSGTDEAAGQATLLIYPSPAAESATIIGEFPDQKPTVLELYNAAGRLIRSWPLPDGGAAAGWTLPLAELAAGQYVAQMKDAAGRVVGLGRLLKL